MGKRNRQYFFEKRGPRTGRAAAERELRSRGSPMRGMDPDRLAAAIDAMRAGRPGPLARIVAEFELRDDTMRSCSRKMRAAAARCPHQVLIREGVGAADRARAEAHRRALEGLWARVRATDAMARNVRGGFRLVLKQMMDAQSFGHAVHEMVWTPRPDGSLDLTLVRVPLQFFECRSGALRYLPDPMLWDGEEMAEGEWMVTAGDCVGAAAAIAACAKRLSLQDWLLFSERCGQPGLHAATDAKMGSEQWDNLVAAIANFGREWGIVTDQATKVDTVSLANGGTPPYPALVERMDRAIAVLYRGSDLSTLSADGGSVGASQQGEEADILEQDTCEMLSETLQEQVERPYIRYMFGDAEPLAYVQVSPVSRPNLDMEMRIDQHLVSLGARLSKREALERYQRTEAAENDPDDEPLRMAQPAAPGGFGLPNERPSPQDRRNGIANPLQNARKGSEVHLPPPAQETRQNANLGLSRLADALGADMAPARDALLALQDLPEAERPAAARELLGRLDELMPADPAMAAVLAEEMAAAFAEGANDELRVTSDERGAALANSAGECRAKDPAHCPVHGTPASSAASAPSGAEKGESESGTPDRNASPTKPKDVVYDPDARNDGRIDFRGQSDKMELAKTQAQEQGYTGVDDMMRQSLDVPQERIDAILRGSDAPCKPHEAIAAIRTRATFKAGNGEDVKLTESLARHYVCGERRWRNDDDPKISNLADFPKAIAMIRDKSTPVLHTIDGEPLYELDRPFPPGTQTQWTRMTKDGRFNAYAWTDSGVLNGWHIRT